MDESWLFRAALVAYAAAAMAWRREQIARLALALALGMHTLALVLRWLAHGHGPFTTMHEILSSNLWSLALVFALAWAWVKGPMRRAWPAVAAVLLMLGAWALMADAGRGHFLPTYATPLLYVHAVLGKLYLGLLLVAAGLSTLAWRRATVLAPGAGTQAAGASSYDELAHRFSAFAFVFDSLMLVAGATWAQDAWGRYWAWDPLETWAFASWLALAALLHARATLRPSPAMHAAWLWGVFALAFLTFFGVPFLSTAPHKGAL